MRGYIAVTPELIGQFQSAGKFHFESAFITTRAFFEDNPEVDEEEREFDLSWLAAVESREIQGSDELLGFVLAVDITSAQAGEEIGYQIQLQSPLDWSQIESLLVAESSDAELTWYASQEISENLAGWIGAGD